MASDLISVSGRYTLLGPSLGGSGGDSSLGGSSGDKDTKPSYVVTVSICAKEALDFTRPKAVVHFWGHSSTGIQESLTDLGQVLPFSSTFLHVPASLASLSPTMVLREIQGVLASLCAAYPSPDSPRFLVYCMTTTTFGAVEAQVSTLLTSFPPCMMLVYITDGKPEVSWSFLQPTLRFCPPTQLLLFDHWLQACGIHEDYHMPATRFGKDLVLETTGTQDFDNLTMYTSNVASFTRHVYSRNVLNEPTCLPYVEGGESGDGAMRHLYHNGPSGTLTSKDHLVFTWTCSSLPVRLSLDGCVIDLDAVEVSPLAILEDALECTPPESTSIRAHSNYFFALALWRHGSSHLKTLVMRHFETSRLFPSRIVSDLTTELLRFSSKHHEHPALAAVIQDLVSRARVCLDGSTLPTVPESEEESGDKRSSDDESLGTYVVEFLSMADRWYQRYLLGSSTSSDPRHRKWSAFWEEAIPLIQSVRSLAQLTTTPSFPPPTNRVALERQFSCMEKLPPLSLH